MAKDPHDSDFIEVSTSIWKEPFYKKPLIMNALINEAFALKAGELKKAPSRRLLKCLEKGLIKV